MVAVAIGFDVAQLFLDGTLIGSIGAPVIDFMAATCFFIWFAVLGVNYSGKNGATKMLISLASFIVELIPIIDALPAITFGVAALIVQTRLEDDPRALFSTKTFLSAAGGFSAKRNLPGEGAATRALRRERFDDGAPLPPLKPAQPLDLRSRPQEGENGKEG
jgi:hypothetical protein